MLSVIPVAVAISSVSWVCTFTFVHTISADHRKNNIIHIQSVCDLSYLMLSHQNLFSKNSRRKLLPLTRWVSIPIYLKLHCEN